MQGSQNYIIKPKIRVVKRRRKVKANASFIDPSLKAQLKPSVERQIRFKYFLYRILDMCYGRSKSRSLQQEWLEITNSFLQNSEDKEKNEILPRVLPSSNFRKPILFPDNFQKPMFILISEKEVEEADLPKYQPYCKQNIPPATYLTYQKQSESVKGLKTYAPLPLKRFSDEIIPVIVHAPHFKTKIIRKFKF